LSVLIQHSPSAMMWNRTSRLAPGCRMAARSAASGDSWAHGAVYSALKKNAPFRRTAPSTSLIRSTGWMGATEFGSSINSLGKRVMVRPGLRVDTADLW